ncbi:DoxX family protein [Paracoccus kondratievae]|uniref:DoxX family protein n=1 Tax=Paracoccus pantotrophus TaxID=82367 RepID=A0A7H9BYK8_PARPN|nr:MULTISPECIES: DoxX family protein [Paracoccus]QFQ88837.1 DoxX family protein [Paracoccus kondratievae]QLH16139.1 DoxX family protein [Paracoccus pantotrophus]
MDKPIHLLTQGLALLLAAFFLFGAWGNLFLSPENEAAYAAWGYPGWFHYVTALCELVAAILLARTATRPYGAGLGAAVMAAALLTTLIHGDYGHSAAPAVVLAVALVVLALSLTHRPATV